ncbi:hypothetical protein ACFPOA_09675 [Lysobacter niabensis]|uniref:hypothetical protein n=1 Tax=Agrilutibacter niabensis TaxID=380628 RepID=UPI003613C248
MGNSQWFAIPACTMLLAGVWAGEAFAGEVKGPPRTVDNTNFTGARTNANSNCAYSGLNDFDSADPVGQIRSIVQTAADAWKYYGLPPGFPGTSGACKGGTNENRVKSSPRS